MARGCREYKKAIQDILKFGVAYVGLVLITGAINHLHACYTRGLTGKGKFYRKD